MNAGNNKRRRNDKINRNFEKKLKKSVAFLWEMVQNKEKADDAYKGVVGIL